MKKILVSLSVISMLGMVAGSALADNSTCTATQCADRGGSVSNKNIMITGTTVTNTNSATILNEVVSTADSGNNSISSGHGDVNNATIVTGNATSSSTVSNKANGITSSVDTTGTDSEATTPATPNAQADRGGSAVSVNVQKNNATVTNAQVSELGNSVGAGSETGMNSVSSHHGDVNTAGVGTGVAMGTVSVGSVTNVTSSMVTR